MSSVVTTFFKSRLFEVLFVGTLLAISALAHGWNMFHFPYYENDEGVYVSQAWSFITDGKLAPYTYWYDHAPFGWMFIGLWTLATGGIFSFGFGLNSGRVFMLVLHVASSLLMYAMMKKMTNSRSAGAIAVLLFSLSPLGIYFQRRVLLDNLMIFWVLVSMFFLLFYRNRLSFVTFSAIALGLAVLTKENAIFFIPVLFYWIWLTAHRKHRSFALTQWMLIVGSIVSLYFYYAWIKGELFPSGSLFGKAYEHVSLLETLKFQGSRGGGSVLDTQNSLFWRFFGVWLDEDRTIILVGLFASVFNLFLGIRNQYARLLSFMSLAMWFFLIRGGIVLEFYIIPLIPLLAMNIGYMVQILRELVAYYLGVVSEQSIARVFVTVLGCVLIYSSFSGFTTSRGEYNLFVADQTSAQLQAVEWIRANAGAEDFIVVDNYAYLDLRARRDKQFPNADWYWKIDTDRDVLQAKLQGRASNIDYLAVTPQMEHDVIENGLVVVGEALQNAQPIAQFWQDGWGVTMWGTRYPQRLLGSSWESYKRHFVVDGQVLDPDGNVTTSEGQAYGLLRAVMMDDRMAFTEVYGWSNTYLRNLNGLYSWKWTDGKIVDKANATDADEDMAIALLAACKKWQLPEYCDDAQKIMAALWEKNVGYVNGIPYLLAGDWADRENELVLNPSYLAPAYYRLFAKADSAHDWDGLVSSSYVALRKCTEMTAGKLPPEWCGLNKKDGSARAVADLPDTSYGFNAFRTPWRVALDYEWFASQEAVDYLSSLEVLGKAWRENGKVNATYFHDGSEKDQYESVAAYLGVYSYFRVVHPAESEKIYQEKILSKFYENRDQAYWDVADNYYTQNLGWFATALYGGQFTELFEALQ